MTSKSTLHTVSMKKKCIILKIVSMNYYLSVLTDRYNASHRAHTDCINCDSNYHEIFVQNK